METEAQQLFHLLDKVGSIGLVFIVYGLLSRRLITRGEFDAVVQQRDRLELRLEKALDYGARAIGASEKLIEKHDR